MKYEEEAINDATGHYYKNPTRLEITEMAENQQEIVDAMKGTYEFGTEQYHYNDGNPEPKPLMGITKIKEMNENEIIQFFKTLFRYRTHITSLHLSLGNYANKRKVSTNKTNALNGKKKRLHSELATLIADIFNDGSRNVVEIKYMISKDPKNFYTRCEIYETSDAEYENEELFQPAFGLEYFTTI